MPARARQTDVRVLVVPLSSQNLVPASNPKMKRLLARRLALATPVLLLAALTGARFFADVPMSVQVPLLLRVLAYDRALARNGGADVVLAVLYDAASDGSVQAKNAFTRAVREGDVRAVNGRPLRVVEVNVAGGNLAASLRSGQASAAYLTPGLEGRLPSIVRSAAESRTLLLCGSEGYVRTGVAVGIGAAAGRPRLLINLPAARTAGADLPAALLNVATVIQ
jgi:hypothetical protein